MSLAARIEATRLGWWIERFWHSRCFFHKWQEVREYEDTGYSHVVVGHWRECVSCGAWERLS